jgi:adenylate cyclase
VAGAGPRQGEGQGPGGSHLLARGTGNRIGAETESELKTWASFLKAYRAQDWDQCDLLMMNLLRMNAKKYLYHLYSDRVASMRLLPFDLEWDGATNFETK